MTCQLQVVIHWKKKQMKMFNLKNLSAVIIAIGTLYQPVLAREIDAQDASKEKKEVGILEVVNVYGRGTRENSAATGLELSPRDTPQSLSVITREQIEDQAALNVTEVLAYTTGLSVKAVDRGRNTLSARGFEINNFQLDGLPFATGNIGLEETSTAIYERIEVVRGATGLLQGAGEPSASVNLVRKHADARELAGEFNLEAGSWNHLAGTADITTPFTGDGAVRGRFVAQYYDQESFVDHETSKGFTLYGVIDADLGEHTRLSVGASHQRDERGGIMWAQLPYWYSDGTRTDWPRSKTTGADWNQWNTTEQTAFITLEHDFGTVWFLRGDLSYHRQEEDSKLIWLTGNPDAETGLGMDIWPYWYNTKPEQWNANLQLNGAYAALGREHELILGAMYNRLSNGWTNRDPISEVAGVGDFHDWDGSYPEPEWGERYEMSDIGTTKQSAIYGATRLHILDPLKLILGARLSSWQRDEEVALYTEEAYTIEHDSVLTPYAGLIYDINAVLSAYLSYTSIFSPQNNKDRNGDYLDPREGDNYEMGLKADLMDGRLRASAAVFRIEQDNFAVVDPEYFVPGTTDPAFRGAEGTVSEGYEIEMQGQVVSGWDVSVGWSEFSAEDADDKPVLTHHPRRVLRLSTKYNLPGDLDNLSIGGSLRRESQTLQTDINPDSGEEETVGQPAYVLVNLFGRYGFNDRTSVQLNVNNIFDESYYNNNGWFAGFIYGEPRNFRLSLNHAF